MAISLEKLWGTETQCYGPHRWQEGRQHTHRRHVLGLRSLTQGLCVNAGQLGEGGLGGILSIKLLVDDNHLLMCVECFGDGKAVTVNVKSLYHKIS